jgi:putative nucleotidyltransferase with HDIG domain
MFIANTYSTLKKKQEIKSKESIIYKFTDLSRKLIEDEDPLKQKQTNKEVFINLIKESLEVIEHKDLIFCINMKNVPPEVVSNPSGPRVVRFICDKFKEIVMEPNPRPFYIFKHDNSQILIFPISVVIKQKQYTIAVGITTTKEWDSATISFFLSTIHSAIIYMKNISYLKTLKTMQEDILQLLANMLEMRDLETYGHSQRVVFLTMEFTKYLGVKDIKKYIWGAYLHDIGKIAIPDKILLKPGKLTDEEFNFIKKHVRYGYNLVKHIESLPDVAKKIVLYHHEKWDGTGYPDGLKGKDIPFEARLFAIIDVFDALISPRPYKPPYPLDQALQIIRDSSGSHFDPDLVEAFLSMMENKRIKRTIQEFITQSSGDKIRSL